MGEAADQEEQHPGDVQAAPDLLRHIHGVAHDALDQRAVADEVAGGEAQGEQPVDHRRLPLEEGLAVERQGHAAEHQAGGEGQPLALVQLALLDQQGAVDDHRGADQHRGGAEDAAEAEGLSGQFDVARVQLVDDEEQDQGDEIDELLHYGSQSPGESA
ncbi:hypothetical protein D3C76_1000440 [compost metagenome]